MSAIDKNTNDILSRIPEDIWNANIYEFARYLIRRGFYEYEITPYKLDVEHRMPYDYYNITIFVKDSCNYQHYHRFTVDAIHVRP